MGGYGSGKWPRQIKKDTTEGGYLTLDVRRLQRDNLLYPGSRFETTWTRQGERLAAIDGRTEAGAVILSYNHRSGGGWESLEYPVGLATTPLHFGGERRWFLCPAPECGRRVALLYLGAEGVFACRHCYGLAYPSQRKPADRRAALRAGCIRRRLGWPGGLLSPPGSRPKGMHRKTFRQLCSQEEAFVDVWVAGREKWADSFKRRYAPFVEAMTKAMAETEG